MTVESVAHRINARPRSIDDQLSTDSLLSRACRSVGLWSILAVVGLAWLGLELLNAAGGGSALQQRIGIVATFPLILVHALVSVSPLPGELVALGNSMLFGFRIGLICNWCGWMLAAMIQYALVRRAASDLQLQETKAWKRCPEWLRSLPVDHPVFLICGRWLPFGAHLVNTSAGCWPVHPWRYAWCAAIGILPVAAVFAALGSQLST